MSSDSVAAPPPMSARYCAVCQRPLTARRSTRKTCSIRCRVKHWRNEERRVERDARRWFYHELLTHGLDPDAERLLDGDPWWAERLSPTQARERAAQYRAGLDGRTARSRRGTISRAAVVRRYRYMSPQLGTGVTVRKARAKATVTPRTPPRRGVTARKRGRR